VAGATGEQQVVVAVGVLAARSPRAEHALRQVRTDGLLLAHLDVLRIAQQGADRCSDLGR
jgi:hypothetical protein